MLYNMLGQIWLMGWSFQPPAVTSVTDLFGTLRVLDSCSVTQMCAAGSHWPCYVQENSSILWAAWSMIGNPSTELGSCSWLRKLGNLPGHRLLEAAALSHLDDTDHFKERWGITPKRLFSLRQPFSLGLQGCAACTQTVYFVQVCSTKII